MKINAHQRAEQLNHCQQNLWQGSCNILQCHTPEGKIGDNRLLTLIIVNNAFQEWKLISDHSSWRGQKQIFNPFWPWFWILVISRGVPRNYSSLLAFQGFFLWPLVLMLIQIWTLKNKKSKKSLKLIDLRCFFLFV